VEAIDNWSAAVVLTTPKRARTLGIAPLGRIVSWGVAGVDPDIMGIGPVPASRQALHRAGLEVQDLDLVEINEAFAAQYVAVERGAGPGPREVERQQRRGQEPGRLQGRYGLASLCIGGGQGNAIGGGGAS